MIQAAPAPIKPHVALVMAGGNRSFSGGVPAVVLARARYLVSRGWYVSVICQGDAGFDVPEQQDGFFVYPIRPGRLGRRIFSKIQSYAPSFLYALGRGLEAAHTRMPIDLVDLQDGAGILGVAPFCSRHAIPMTFTLHGSAAINPGRRPWIGRQLHIHYEARAYRHAVHIIPVSHFMATVAARFKATAPITVLPTPVDATFNTGTRLSISATERLRLLFVGRMVPEKRLDVALQALALLPRGKFLLTILGTGPDERKMKHLARTLGIEGDLDWKGHIHNRAEVNAIFRQSHIFLSPTEFEAQGIALLEAILSGLYPVVSDIPVLREMVPPKYTTALGSAADLAERIAHLDVHRQELLQSKPELADIARHYSANLLYTQLEHIYMSSFCNTL